MERHPISRRHSLRQVGDSSGLKTADTNWVGMRIRVTAAAKAPSVYASSERVAASQGTEPLLAKRADRPGQKEDKGLDRRLRATNPRAREPRGAQPSTDHEAGSRRYAAGDGQGEQGRHVQEHENADQGESKEAVTRELHGNGDEVSSA